MAGLAGCATTTSDGGSFPDGDWPMVGGDPRNTSSLPGARLPDRVEPAWQAPLGGWRLTAPVVADGTVLVGSNRRYRAFAAADGSPVWEMRLPSRDGDDVLPHEVAGSPAHAADAGVVILTSDEGGRDGRGAFVHGVDAATGAERWRREAPGRHAYSVRVADGTAYLRTSTACLALSPADGRVEWRRDGFEPLAYEAFNLGEGFGVGVAPTVADGTVYVPDRNRLRALDAATGAERWSVALPSLVAAPTVHAGRVYARGYSSESRTVALTPDGEEVWRRAGGGMASPAASDDAVVVTDGNVVVLDAASGEERWRWDLRTDVVRAAPVVASDAVVALGNRSAALTRDRSLFGGRVRWTLPTDLTPTVSPAVAAGHLYAVDPFTDRLVAFAGA
jgi:outer membrane protein assembly factor BamB